MNIRIVEADFANIAHASGIVKVLDSYASDSIGGGKPLSENVRQNLVQALREQPNCLVLLAFVEEEPTGIAICFTGFSTFQARQLLNIHDLAVVPHLRGKGIGSALLAEVERRALDRDYCKLTLEVQEDNHRARSVYERFGFEDFVVGDSAPSRFLSKTLRSAVDRN